jgi:tetratricopeptide (TPR) repeat protein
VLLLTALYVDQGRYAAALKANLLTRLLNEKNPFSPLYLKISVAVIEGECLSQSGRFLAARKIFTPLMSRLDKAYQKDPSTQNWETLCVLQSVVVAYEQVFGDKDQARSLWSRTVSVAESPRELTGTTAYAYEGLSNAAVAMGDFEAALRYADLATEHYKRARMTSKCVAGSLAAARAEAHLALGHIEDAEKQAHLALKEWGFYLRETAGVTARVYYVLGSIEMHRGNHLKALEHLDLASSIVRKRKGVLSPALLPCLSAYGQCLRDSARPFDAELIEREIVEISQYHNVTDHAEIEMGT